MGMELTEPESSVAVGSVHVTADVPSPLDASIVMSDGQPAMTGAVSSAAAELSKSRREEDMTGSQHKNRMTYMDNVTETHDYAELDEHCFYMKICLSQV